MTSAGGNLFDLASKAYGDPTAWPTIARANKLTDPALAGVQTIIIPPTPDGSGGRVWRLILSQYRLARQPRGVVKVNDLRMDGWIRWEVDNNTYYEADTFRVTFALSALPVAYGDAWWASQQEIFIEIFAGFPVDAENYSATELQSLTYGRVDDVTFDPVARTLQVSGRDLTAMLIDAKTSETFQNLTASQIATQIAQRHGLTTTYVTATSKRSGKYYQIDQVRVNQQRSEWDLLTALAGEEEFAVYVKRKDLHFEPAVAPGANPYSTEMGAADRPERGFRVQRAIDQFQPGVKFRARRGRYCHVGQSENRAGDQSHLPGQGREHQARPEQGAGPAVQLHVRAPDL
ncbi:hypothetical protein ACFS07_10480 [Undibacterium arcticum]